MSVKFRVPKSLCWGGAFLAFSLAVWGQNTPTTNPPAVSKSGTEFSILGAVAGDQVLPSLSLTPAGGCVVWQDNWLDKKGGGLGGSLLNGNFQAGQKFRLDNVLAGNHLKPQVQMLADGNAIFVWQSSASGIPCIYARLARNPKNPGAYGTNFYTADIRVNTYIADQQVDPAVAALPDGSAIVTWASYGEDGSLWGVYARKLMATGKGVPAREFLVNQYTAYNQRNPAVAALAGGNYVIAWVSEQERFANSVSIYARVFSSEGVALTDEIPVNSGTDVCDAPAVAPLNDGGFTVVWAQQNSVLVTNGWDVWGRAFSASGTPEVSDFTINTYLYGDQYAPKIAASPAGSLVVWTSLGEDGSREGVFGRFLAGGTQVSGPEFQVNTTYISQQIQPVVAWDGVSRFLAVWTSFAGTSGFDLYGQAFSVNSP